MTLFKDMYEVTHKSRQKEAIHCLSEKIKNNLKRELLLGSSTRKKKQTPNHSICDFKDGDSNRETEKRMCRCMFYHNLEKEEQKTKCKKCKYEHKWKHDVSDGFNICEYEYPSEYKKNSIGGVDLVICDDKKKYAVEMKTSSSKETVCRMISEILTYTLDENFKDCIPAIGFFDKDYKNNKKNEQKMQYEEYKEDDDFAEIIKREKIAVFEFSIDEKSKKFSIKKIN